MYPAQGAYQRHKRLREGGQPKHSKMQHVSVCFISLHVSVLYQAQRAMHRRLREQQLQQLKIWDQWNLFAETDAASAWQQTLQPKASACYPNKKPQCNTGPFLYTRDLLLLSEKVRKVETMWTIVILKLTGQNGRAMIRGSTGTVQFLFISSDICHQGSIQNLWVQGAAKQQSQKATTWITAFIPKHECQGCADVLWHGKSASRKPWSPEGAPSGRAGASARSRIWQKVNCQITKD